MTSTLYFRQRHARRREQERRVSTEDLRERSAPRDRERERERDRERERERHRHHHKDRHRERDEMPIREHK